MAISHECSEENHIYRLIDQQRSPERNSRVIVNISHTYIRLPKTYDLYRVRLNGLNEFNYAKYVQKERNLLFVHENFQMGL